MTFLGANFTYFSAVTSPAGPLAPISFLYSRTIIYLLSVTTSCNNCLSYTYVHGSREKYCIILLAKLMLFVCHKQFMMYTPTMFRLKFHWQTERVHSLVLSALLILIVFGDHLRSITRRDCLYSLDDRPVRGTFSALKMPLANLTNTFWVLSLTE